MLNKYLLYLYLFLSILATYWMIKTPLKNYDAEWFFKIIILYVSFFVFILAMFYTNNIINNYLLPFLLFLNIAILFTVSLSYKITIKNIIALLGLLYLLCTFKYKDFRFKKGFLQTVNKKWIYSYVFFIILFFLISDFVEMKIMCSLLLLYPLLFPLNQYYIHRIFSLFITTTFYYKFKLKLI